MKHEPNGEMLEAYHRVIVQNAQKGETYRIRFTGDSGVVEGIPVPTQKMRAGEAETFELRLTGSGAGETVQQRSAFDIIELEKIP